MAFKELTCGCKILNQGCVISPRCRAVPPHSETNRPGGPALPTPKQAQKAQEARDSGRKLKPGRHRLDVATGRVEPVRQRDAEGVYEPADGVLTPDPALGATDAEGGPS